MIVKLLSSFVWLIEVLLAKNKYNLSRSNSSNHFDYKGIFLSVFLFLSVTLVHAATITSIGSGNWNATTTWVGGVVPVAGDNVIIATATAVTVTASTSITDLEVKGASGKLIINSGITLTVTGSFLNNATKTNGVNGPGSIMFTGTTNLNRLSSSGIRPNVLIGNGISTNTVTTSGPILMADLTVNSNAILINNNKTLGISGDLKVNGTLLNNGTKAYTFSGTGKTISGSSPSITIYNGVFNGSYTNNLALFTITNNLTGAGSLTNSANKTLNVGRNATIITLVATATGNTVNFFRVGTQTAKPTTYYNLTLSGSGIKTLTSVTVNGTLSMEGTATVSTAPTYGTAAKLQYNRTVDQTAGAEWVTPFVATGGVSIVNSGLITTNGAKVFNASVPLTIANDSGGGLDNGSFAISGGSVFTLANDANLYLSGTSTFPSGFTTNALGAASTVEYKGTAQAVGVQNYGNLTLNNPGNKTFAGATTIAGELAINNSAVALLLNGTTSYCETLTFNGVSKASTSWGGTGSSAMNPDSARFGSTTTGIIFANLACTTGVWLGVFSTDWNNTNNWCSGVIPTATTNVSISSAAFQPTIGTTGGLCKNMTIAALSTLTINSSSALEVSGNWLNNGTLSSSGTINFNGVATQNVGGSGNNGFNNLSISNSVAAVKATAGITVNGSLNIVNTSSVLDMGTFALGGTFINSGLGEIKTANTTTSPIPAGKTWTNNVVYNKPDAGQKVVGGTYNSLTLANTTGTQTATGNIIVSNQFNIPTGDPLFKMNGNNLTVGDFNITTSDAIIDMAGGSLNYTTITSMDGTIRFSGATNGKAIPAGTIDYYGTSQTVTGGTYNDLSFSGNGGYSITTDIIVNNALSINKGIVTVMGGISITVDNDITVINPNASFVFENNASLVQVDDDAVNEGTISYKRNTSAIKRYDFTYWSSPVSGQSLYNLSPNTLGDKYYSYTASGGYKIEYNGAATMAVGYGYLIRAPQSFDIETAIVDTAPTFKGIPNNGVILTSAGLPINLAGNNYHLLGNPYPSALDADTFLAINSAVLQGTLYFWTHFNKPSKEIKSNDGAIYNYNANDYASYNLSGGTGTGTAALSGEIIPLGKIASGQGFFALSTPAGGDLVFNNSMRVGVGIITGNNSQFYRTTGNAKTKSIIEKNRVWLNMSSKEGAFKQALVAYITGATNEYDEKFDGFTFDGYGILDFYSVTPNGNFVIQGRGLPFNDSDVVPLGFRSVIGGDFTISIDQTDGLLTSQNVFLEDKLLNIIHDLKTASYNFSIDEGRVNNRFVLRYTDRTLGNDDFAVLSSQIIVSRDKNELRIKSAIDTIKKVTVYDLLGKKVFEKNVDSSTEFRSSTIGLNKQIGIVRVTLDNGQVVSRKVSF